MASADITLTIKVADAKPVRALIEALLDLTPFLERNYEVTQTPEYQRFETALEPFKAKSES